MNGATADKVGQLRAQSATWKWVTWEREGSCAVHSDKWIGPRSTAVTSVVSRVSSQSKVLHSPGRQPTLQEERRSSSTVRRQVDGDESRP